MFVVCSINYEYNDEINYYAGLDKPVAVFPTKQEADKYIISNTLKEVIRKLQMNNLKIN